MREAGAGIEGGSVELEIVRLGAQGDGVGELAKGASIFVPYALAGERVVAAVTGERGRLGTVLRPSPVRVSPPCPHFMICGGCALQHLADEPYREWKRGLVVEAFAQRGIATDVGALQSVGAGARRRAVMSALSSRGSITLGFHGARQADLVEVGTCHVLDPQIVAALEPLKFLLGVLPAWEGEARVSILACDNGLDVGVMAAAPPGRLDAERSARLAAAATLVPHLVRVSLDETPVYQNGQPMIAMGQAQLTPPPGVFLQASRTAERIMAAAILQALPKRAKRVADLFAGVGAFTFPLAGRVSVLSVDSDARALSALDAARRAAQGVKPINTLQRDLFREPLSRKELEGFDMVVFDPPRAGAMAQTQMLAKAKVPVVVAVSCNPATLARDARILIDAGYRLAAVTPIDQFHWSAHVEAIAVFELTKR